MSMQPESSQQPESLTKALWLRARAGDRIAYEQLFSVHTERLLIFIRAHLGSALREKTEAEDILQEAYAAALHSFDSFEYTDDGAFLRWMCRIIDHRLRDAHDYFSARKRQPEARPHSAPTGPVTALGRSEDRARLEAALGQLSAEHREVILLRYFQGLSADEASVRLQRSAGAVRSLSARALVELGKLLQKDQDTHA